MRDLRGALGKSEVAAKFGLITNGVFLSRALVERWLPLGLAAAQVTLDGDETTHSITRRSRKPGEETFARIFANVAEASPLIAITVKGNYQADTVHGFVPLLPRLKEAGLPAGASVHFAPALATLGAPSDSASGSCTWGGSSPEIMIALSDEVRRAGFDPGDPVVLGPCGFHSHHHYAVEPEGRIYKCAGFLGHPEWAIGDVVDGLGSRYQDMAKSDPQRECGACVHRPSCGGGCVASAWLRAGRAEGVNCELSYFEGQKMQLMARKYALAVADNLDEALEMFPQAAPLPTAAPERRRLRLTA